MSFDQLAGDLYAIDPDDFVTARKAASDAAKQAGDRPLAKALLGLKRPTRSAWLVNQLVTRQPEVADQLRDTATALAEAHAEGDLSALRDAGQRRTRLVADLTGRAVRLGVDLGYTGTETVRAEVSSTLTAAMADPSALAEVLAGRVVRALVYAGFGPGLASAVPVSSPATKPLTPAAEDRDVVELTAAKARAVQAGAAHAQALSALESAEDDQASAAAALDVASKELAELRAELRAAEAVELTSREAVSVALDALHDARGAEQAARAEAVRAQTALAALGLPEPHSSSGS